MSQPTIAVARPAPWRNARVRRALGQVLFLLIVGWALRELYLNLEFGTRRIGQGLSYDFLQTRSGIPIKEGIDYNPNQSYLKAYLVALVNTLRVAGVGIVLASVLGLVVGVARLSTNWLVRKTAQVYVEAIRNTPVLIQIIFWYVAVILTLPLIGGEPVAGVFVSNRGTAIPWLRLDAGAGVLGLLLLVALVVGAAAWLWRTRYNERTGRPHHRVRWSIGAFLLLAAVGFLVTGGPIHLEMPELAGRRIRGGFQVSSEFTAVLVGLVVYTAAFIAEIVRGSILAVDKGQKEAAMALGFTPFQQLRLVVLPQAARIAIPPINSQFLNLTKNSSLAVAVGYPELASVSSTIINQAGRAFQVTIMVMLTYMTLSLAISFVMNVLNRSVALRGVRR
ncbi:MAG TPA: ABC transporter permease subunit [Actinomycetota bacterium]|nr:ABC transporter permease subunit [Actinomycetota bacterium]